MARRIQMGNLPAPYRNTAAFQVATRYVPMTSVAGDFYDFVVADEAQAGLLIADVSGHGVPAALIASMVKLAAIAQKEHANEPATLLAGMNATLCGNTQNQFVTAAYVHLDAQAKVLRYAAAAHPAMLRVRQGEVTAIEENGLMLGAFSFATFTSMESKLEAGDRYVLYTDGIVEAANGRKEEFGSERLREVLRGSSNLSVEDVADRVLAEVRGWARSQDDDLTVVVCDFAGR